MSDIYRFDEVKKYYIASKAGLIESIFRVKPVYVHALDGVTFSLEKGKVLALVGESGSGKTTIGKLMATMEVQNSGKLYFKGREVSKDTYGSVRKSLSMVFQNPATSLNSRMRIGELVSEPLGKFDGQKTSEALSSVGLSLAEIKDKQPRELSGGQVQRVAIARALVKHPELVILDEPTSALDESVQAQILNILVDLQEELKLTYLFITHNIAVARYLSDEIIVLYAGKIVEMGESSTVLSEPKHPYTQLLLKSVPTIESGELTAPAGDVPSLLNPPSGCRFHTRCPFVMDRCRIEEPPLLSSNGEKVACWLYA